MNVGEVHQAKQILHIAVMPGNILNNVFPHIAIIHPFESIVDEANGYRLRLYSFIPGHSQFRIGESLF